VMGSLGGDGRLVWVEVGVEVGTGGSDETVMLAPVEITVAHCDKYRTVTPEPSAPMPVESRPFPKPSHWRSVEVIEPL